MSGLYSILKHFDADGNGTIDENDFIVVLNKIGLGFIGEMIARSAFRKLDKNRNGKIEFEEAVGLIGYLRDKHQKDEHNNSNRMEPMQRVEQMSGAYSGNYENQQRGYGNYNSEGRFGGGYNESRAYDGPRGYEGPPPPGGMSMNAYGPPTGGFGGPSFYGGPGGYGSQGMYSAPGGFGNVGMYGAPGGLNNPAAFLGPPGFNGPSGLPGYYGPPQGGYAGPNPYGGPGGGYGFPGNFNGPSAYNGSGGGYGW